MNAIQFLINEHDKIRSAFAQIADGGYPIQTRKKLLEDLCITLLIHENMEQEVWYYFLKKQDDHLKEIITHLVNEEREVEEELKEILRMNASSDWQEKFIQIRKNVEHHAQEEEIRLFPMVKELLDRGVLKELGREMQEYKAEFREAA